MTLNVIMPDGKRNRYWRTTNAWLGRRLSGRLDDLKRGVTQADVYQMMAYGRTYEGRRLMLLYPHHSGLGNSGSLLSRYLITGGLDELTIATIDLSRLSDVGTRLRELTEAVLRPGPSSLKAELREPGTIAAASC